MLNFSRVQFQKKQRKKVRYQRNKQVKGNRSEKALQKCYSLKDDAFLNLVTRFADIVGMLKHIGLAVNSLASKLGKV